MQCDRVMGWLAVHVMTKRYKVVIVGKRDNTLGVGLGNGKQTFENIAQPLSQLRIEIM